MEVTPKQLSELLAKSIPAGESVLIVGAPGIGKTNIVEQAAAAAKADLLLSHPVVEDPTDAKGLPWPKKDGKTADFLPFGNLAKAINVTTRTAWFLDDLGQATPATQASYMQLILKGEVNGHKLPDFITFVAATNERGHRAGVSGILEPVKSRFRTIVKLVANIDDWTNWAYSANIPPMLIAFLRFRPDLLSKFEATADMTNSPSPRTWANLARMEALALSPETELAAFGGSVGAGAAGEYLAFRKIAATLPNLDAIIQNPSKAPIPTQPSELYATVVGLAAKATPANFGSLATYATRLATEKDAKGHTHGEFAVLLSRDASGRDPKITYTQAFNQLAAGVVGDLINGRS